MNIKEEIEISIEKALNDLYHNFYDRTKHGIGVLVEIPREKSHGDYSTNVALSLSKNLKKNPIEVAKDIIFKVKKKDLFEKIEVAPPGFINFYLKKEVFIDNLKKILKEKAKFGQNHALKNQKIIVEYTDPNILKEFHIGHLMSNSIGESLSRIIEFRGVKVKKLCYQGDVGLHVAKAIWGYQHLDVIGKPSEIGRWAMAYMYGVKMYENPTFKLEIDALNKKIFQKNDAEINKLYEKGKKISLDYFGYIYKKLGTKFDYLFFESETAEFGKKIVEEGLKKLIFEKGEKGSIIFNGEKYGLHKRVFINWEGIPTYEAKELGLAKIKYDKYKYDNSIIVTANEQNEYFRVVLKAMSEVFPELEKKTLHIGHGVMRLPEGKMSSRAGRVVTAESLIEKAKKMILQKLAQRDFSQKEKEEIAEKIAMGAIKYSILKQSIGSDIIFDFKKSISFEGDSGPYLQYSFARANSVLEKAKKEKIKSDPNLRMYPNNPNNLERIMIHFPEVVEEAGEKYEPHLIASYLIELAREFNNYYAHSKIVDKKDKFSPYKVALTKSFSIIVKNGLWLLGIPAPEKM